MALILRVLSFRVLPAAAVVFLAAGCSSSSSSPTGPGGSGGAAEGGLVGPIWRLQSLGGSPAVPGSEVTAIFSADDRVSGRGGCNSYFGSARAASGTVTIGPLGATKMACLEGGLMAQEDAYFEALAGSRYYEVRGGQLRLGPTVASVSLVFVAR